MNNKFGNKIKISVQGESYSNKIRLIMSGFKHEHKIDASFMTSDLTRRNPKAFYNTQRKEEDVPCFDKGIVDYKINSSKIAISVKNNHRNNADYSVNKGFLRPSHSDYVNYIKYGEIKKGGGTSSGRITLPIVIAGAIAKSILKEKGISFESRIRSVGELEENEFSQSLYKNDSLYTSSKKFHDQAIDYLEKIVKEKDTVGGSLEVRIDGVSAGVGEPLFDSVESIISHLAFSIPSVKGIYFGSKNIYREKGTEAKDEFVLDEGNIKTKTNNNGGINGGISNGMPIIFGLEFKPIPTFKQKMNSLNIETNKQETTVFEGNHDVFVGNRLLPVAEAIAAIALLELMYE